MMYKLSQELLIWENWSLLAKLFATTQRSPLIRPVWFPLIEDKKFQSFLHPQLSISYYLFYVWSYFFVFLIYIFCNIK